LLLFESAEVPADGSVKGVAVAVVDEQRPLLGEGGVLEVQRWCGGLLLHGVFPFQ
jgi:hypothetical protein